MIVFEMIYNIFFLNFFRYSIKNKKRTSMYSLAHTWCDGRPVLASSAFAVLNICGWRASVCSLFSVLSSMRLWTRPRKRRPKQRPDRKWRKLVRFWLRNARPHQSFLFPQYLQIGKKGNLLSSLYYTNGILKPNTWLRFSYKFQFWFYWLDKLVNFLLINFEPKQFITFVVLSTAELFLNLL